MEPIEQLRYLKTLTLRTGAIHDAQVLQLKSYPFVIPNIIGAEINIDPENHLVIYKLSFSGDKRPRKTKKITSALENITKWTQYLLWYDTKVTFQHKNKVL